MSGSKDNKKASKRVKDRGKKGGWKDRRLTENIQEFLKNRESFRQRMVTK